MTGRDTRENGAPEEPLHGTPPMRTTRTAQIGNVGQLEAAANFARINWGPSDNQPHDLGTDNWVQVRNAEGDDLRCLVGVQVRTGDSYFDTPDCIDGAEGWWHDGLDTRHVQHWLHHSNNHLLVLHDLHTKVSYWEYINRKTAVSTGKRFKVFVPKNQTVDKANLEDLIDVARSQPEARRDIGRIGSSEEPCNVEAEQRLRYALAAPQLIAPPTPQRAR